ncbi:uncharacterized protein LOC130014745 [Mercurialis annua]|uniref:uncharacterized protein LOC130014745 n=1 Tax=Mercurialis annua TaxID=3986 RepID=UPI0024AD09B6|nr:uncharacterized protein LOC130014745 [Mercurialis annua]
MLSGWSTKGKLACPVCNKWTCLLTLKNGRKQCYMGHHRYLHSQHSWRKNKKFDGKLERRSKLEELTGDEVLRQFEFVPKDLVFGKTPNRKKRVRSPQELNWTKRKKNICENILGTSMNIDGKSKDNIKARMDLKAMGIRKELHLQPKGNKFLMPLACYTLPTLERRKFCEWMKSIKLPDGYTSNLSRCVNVEDCKILGMKSHDYQVFMQRLLPAAICGSLRSEVYIALSELSSFFKELCSKTLIKSTIKKLQSDIVLILCKLEMIYPPSFFVIMMHLAIHLPREVELGGPVHYRWMYFIERFLGTLKNFVRNLARPEGSIAEPYITKECLNFCSLYFHGVETRYNRVERNYDMAMQVGVHDGFSVFAHNARPLGAVMYEKLSHSDFEKILWYVLNNCENIEEYLNMHIEELEKTSLIDVRKRHQEGFSSWFKQYVGRLCVDGLITTTDHLYVLGLGPDIRVTRYSGIIANGVRFHTTERDSFRRTQNSGVSVKGEHNLKEIDFFGVLTDIIDLQYIHGNHVFLFKLHQVFYVNDMKNGGPWKIMQKSYPRNIYDVPEKKESYNEDSVLNDEPYQQYETDYLHEVEQVDGEDLESLHHIDVKFSGRAL